MIQKMGKAKRWINAKYGKREVGTGYLYGLPFIFPFDRPAGQKQYVQEAFHEPGLNDFVSDSLKCKRFIDFGAGWGSVGIYWSYLTGKTAILVDTDEDMRNLCHGNAKINKADVVVCGSPAEEIAGLYSPYRGTAVKVDIEGGETELFLEHGKALCKAPALYVECHNWLSAKAVEGALIKAGRSYSVEALGKRLIIISHMIQPLEGRQ